MSEGGREGLSVRGVAERRTQITSDCTVYRYTRGGGAQTRRLDHGHVNIIQAERSGFI